MIRTPSKVMMVSSSPGRAPEKLPAPMLTTTLLRGKGGSRSRGRSSAAVSRSSPMFPARSRRSSSGGAQEEEKEPSSPTVTCIGQVRISKRKPSAKGSSSSSSSRSKQEQGGCVPEGCRCFRRGFLCNPFSKGFGGAKFKPSSASASPCRHHGLRGWRKWFLLRRPGRYRKGKPPRQWQIEEDPRTPTGVLPPAAGSDSEGERSEVEEEDEAETKVFVPTTPPKNALLLMRCRSAPHRAACGVPDRFWAAESDGAAGSNVGAAAAPGVMEPIDVDRSVSTYEARAGSTDGGGGGGESREGEDDADGEGAAAVGPSPSFSSRPLILTRCKSEPARTAAKLAAPPDASYCFWNSGSNPSPKPSRSKNSSSSNNNNKRWLTLLGEARPIPSQ